MLFSPLMSVGGPSAPAPAQAGGAQRAGGLSLMAPQRVAGGLGLMPPPPAVPPPRHAELQILSALQTLQSTVQAQGAQMSSFIEHQNGVNQKFEFDLGYLRNNQGSSSSSSGSKRSRHSQQDGSVDEEDGIENEDEDGGVLKKRVKRASGREAISRAVMYKQMPLPSLKTAVDAVWRCDKYVEPGDFPTKIGLFHIGYVRKHTLVKTAVEVDEVYNTVRCEAAQCSAAISARLASCRASAGLSCSVE